MISLRRSWACIAALLLSVVLFNGVTPVKGDASFIDVRTKLDKDRSGKKGDPKDKYFREFSVFSDLAARLIVHLIRRIYVCITLGTINWAY